jgi:hypothetical protein
MYDLQLLSFLPFGYLWTILLEGPILLASLSKGIPLGRRGFLAVWLTACTYPIVILVLPVLLDASKNRSIYLLVAESFAIVAECLLFVLACTPKVNLAFYRDLTVIAIANLTSFLVAEMWWRLSSNY